MDGTMQLIRCEICNKPTIIQDIVFAEAKIYHADCIRIKHYSEQQLKEMNDSKKHMLEQCKK